MHDDSNVFQCRNDQQLSKKECRCDKLLRHFLVPPLLVTSRLHLAVNFSVVLEFQCQITFHSGAMTILWIWHPAAKDEIAGSTPGLSKRIPMQKHSSSVLEGLANKLQEVLNRLEALFEV